MVKSGPSAQRPGDPVATVLRMSDVIPRATSSSQIVNANFLTTVLASGSIQAGPRYSCIVYVGPDNHVRIVKILRGS